MKLSHKIFSIILAAVVTAPALAGQKDCSNASYRRTHPTRCQNYESNKTSNTVLTLAGGAALVGVGVALAQNSSGSHGSSSEITNQDTMFRSSGTEIAQTHDYSKTDTVKNQRIASSYLDSLTNGADIDAAKIKRIQNSSDYAKNSVQMGQIKYAWAAARGFTGKNTTIAILDDFNSYHGYAVSDLASDVASGAKIKTYNLTTGSNNFMSYDAIANIISKTSNTDIYNSSWQIDSSATLNAATVIYNGQNTKTYAEAQQYMTGITSANFINSIIDTAVNSDSIFVWAAGNEAKSESGALSAMPLAFPELQGHFVNVISLNNYGTIAWYSNECGVTQNYCIAAPGSSYQTTASDVKVSGTSFAAPVVSGAIATIKEAFPYMSANQITELLFVTATDLGEPGVDSVYGWGLLDMEKATQPVGTPKIVLSNDTIQPLTTTSVSGTAASAIKKANVKIAFIDDFGRSFTTNLSDNIKVKPYGRGFAKLHDNENNSVTLFDTVEFGLKQSDLLESNGLLSTKSDNLMNFVGYKNNFNIGEVNFYQNVRFGMSLPRANENSMISGFSNVYTANIKTGLNWKDFGFEVAIPDTIISGDMYMNLPTGRADNGDYTYQNAKINLKTKPALEYTVKYKALSATFVDNPDYQDEFFIMFKTKRAF